MSSACKITPGTHFNLLDGPELLLANREVELSLCAEGRGQDVWRIERIWKQTDVRPAIIDQL